MDILQTLLGKTSWLSVFRDAAQFLIVLCFFALVWQRLVGSQAERLLKGVVILASVCICSYALGFSLITSLVQKLMPFAFLIGVIVFQPEIRRSLAYLGSARPFRFDTASLGAERERQEHDIEQIIVAVKELSRNRFGALIVIDSAEGERDYLSPGTHINADISSNLILSIFYPKSPLHDGALVIKRNKILAAGVILPMTDDPKLSYKYGTRHRAAIGLSEIYDGLCLVVSEESGSISAASRGKLIRYSGADLLQEAITEIYQRKSSDHKLRLIASWFKKQPQKKHSATITDGIIATLQSPTPEESRIDQAPQAEGIQQ
jgi:diadenylate cyclase